MTNEPRRLSKSGGVSQRLLDSASLDVPSAAARQRAALLAATESSFSSTMSGEGATAQTPRPNVVRTLGTWTFIGAAASVALALAGSKLFEASRPPSAARAAEPALVELPPPSRSPDIAAEPSAAPSEAAELELARTALKRGDVAAALKALDAYDAAYPKASLRDEATRLRALALAAAKPR